MNLGLAFNLDVDLASREVVAAHAQDHALVTRLDRQLETGFGQSVLLGSRAHLRERPVDACRPQVANQRVDAGLVGGRLQRRLEGPALANLLQENRVLTGPVHPDRTDLLLFQAQEALLPLLGRLARLLAFDLVEVDPEDQGQECSKEDADLFHGHHPETAREPFPYPEPPRGGRWGTAQGRRASFPPEPHRHAEDQGHQRHEDEVAQNIRVDSLRVRLTLRFSGSLDWIATRSVSSANQLTVIRRKSPLADVVE